MKTVELLIDEEQETFGIEAISLVRFPAIEENFVFFNRNNKFTFAKVDEEKRLLIGPALIPNKMIARFNEQTNEEYEVFFSEATVERAAALFMEQKRTSEYTLEHNEKTEGLTVFESWIVTDNTRDKSSVYGFDVPNGTWMVSVKVGNPDVWAGVKDKDYRGFSIEGYFVDSLVKMEDVTIANISKALKEVLEPMAFLDGKPLFGSVLEAKLYAELLGCSGHHPHEVNGKVLFMPCDAHEETPSELDLAAYPWEQCILDQTEKYGSKETAEKICGAIKAQYGG